MQFYAQKGKEGEIRNLHLHVVVDDDGQKMNPRRSTNSKAIETLCNVVSNSIERSRGSRNAFSDVPPPAHN